MSGFRWTLVRLIDDALAAAAFGISAVVLLPTSVDVTLLSSVFAGRFLSTTDISYVHKS